MIGQIDFIWACPPQGLSVCSRLITRGKLIYSKEKIQYRIMEMPLTKADSSRVIPALQSNSVHAPSHPLPKSRKKRDRSGANFRKRWRTLVKTGSELHQDYGARIYFSISLPRTRKDFVFRSSKEVSPIQPTELVNNPFLYRWQC